MIFEPIVGISTKLGESAVNIVRISGEGSFDIVSKVWKGPRIQDAFTHTVLYGHIVDHEETIDEVMVSIFRSPRSFTTEDTVEIQCHGGSFIAMEIVKLLLREGARMAERGEFSRRAFLHGRIDLTQAESIMDMIAAKTKDQLRLANASLRGGIKELVRGMQDDLLSIIATIEVNIDYPEYDDVEMLTTEILLPRMQLLEERMHQIVHASKAGARIKNGLSTAIVGRPNVGKSSLLNSLLKEERAIVTEVSGTTRDLIEAELDLHGILIRLVDTAGIRQTEDLVEKIGIERSKKAIEQAELVLLVFDQSQPLDEQDKALLELTKDKHRILIGNKMDLGKVIDLQGEVFIPISAKENTGLDQIEHRIREMFFEGSLEEKHEAMFSNARQIALLEESHQTLLDAITTAKASIPVDLIEIDLRKAWGILGTITGESTEDDLIDTLFSKFCLGK